MAAESFLGSLGSGLIDFAGSGLGQTAIGAGLGFGADRLAGGSGGIGAGLGALGGLGNSAFSNGGLFGQDSFSGSIADQALSGVGGLFGQGSNQASFL